MPPEKPLASEISASGKPRLVKNLCCFLQKGTLGSQITITSKWFILIKSEIKSLNFLLPAPRTFQHMTLNIVNIGEEGLENPKDNSNHILHISGG